MDDAEDRDAGADSEAGDEDGEGREAGVAPQDADGVTQILKELGEGYARLDVRVAPFVYGTGRDPDRQGGKERRADNEMPVANQSQKVYRSFFRGRF